jgi:hypothetical protein
MQIRRHQLEKRLKMLFHLPLSAGNGSPLTAVAQPHNTEVTLQRLIIPVIIDLIFCRPPQQLLIRLRGSFSCEGLVCHFNPKSNRLFPSFLIAMTPDRPALCFRFSGNNHFGQPVHMRHAFLHRFCNQ